MPKTLSSDDASTMPADASAHQQLSAMIDAGRAFSGHERNCCFLNTGDGRFANLSSGSGLDFPDDGRAVAVTDWDQDGDLDLWISNRNAPRLRLMRNEATAGNHHLALLLIGDGERNNRDAVGARAEVKLVGRTGGKRLATSVRAGEGFLSQSSKWLHFGLGTDAEIESILVRWPDGREETFAGIEADRRYRIRQGEGSATPSPIRNLGALKLSPGTQIPASSGGAARIPAVTLLRAPRINLKRSDGRSAGPTAGGRSQLINLWATWCAPCLEELGQFRDQADALRAAGVDVLALNVDGIGGSTPGSRDPAAVLAELRFPFPATTATRPLVDALQDLHNRVVGLNRPLPVPTSFLIDPQGRLSVIYKGSVSVEQVILDLGHSQGTLAERAQRAAQIPGSMISHPLAVHAAEIQEASIQHRYGVILEEIKDLESADYHFRSALALDPNSADSARRLAQINLDRREWTSAAEFFEIALRLNPDDPDGHQALGQLYAGLGDAAAAQREFETALRQNPQHALANFGLAAVCDAQGDAARAIRLYEAGLKSQPDNQMAANNLAWILATHPDDSIRDPEKAISLARELHTASGGKVPHLLDTLAAAEAATGDYQAAATTITQAIELALSKGNQSLAKDLKNRLETYQSGQPYFDQRTAP